MIRTRILFVALSILVLLPIAGGTLAFARAQDDGDASDSQYKYITVFLETLQLIRRNYVEETDMSALIEGALQGSTDALDPFSTYVPAEEVDHYRQSREIGDSRSGLVAAKERGITYVVGVAPESPAERAGIRFGDVISSVRGQTSRTLPLWKLQNMLASDPGDEIEIEILRQGQPEAKTIVLGAFETAKPGVVRERGVPVLSIPRLDETSVDAVRSLLQGLTASNEARLLIDLRGSGAAGASEIAFQFGELFVSGDVGKLMRRDAVVESYSAAIEPLWSGEIVVLIDRGTVGPAEILAGVLRDRGDAELVGERSFGYAGRQATITLGGGSGLFYTDAFYATPDGQLIDEGLTPDVSVAGRRPSDDEAEEAPDPILERGIDLLLGVADEPALPKAA